MKQLLCCPFCGNDEIDLNHIVHKFLPEEFEVSCFEPKCLASIAAPTMDGAIERWNRRSGRSLEAA